MNRSAYGNDVALSGACTIALMMIACSPAYGDYEPIPLHELVVRSDLLVRGTIIEVREKTFEVDVHEVIHGEANGKRIEVQRFVDWTGNARWTSYREGQELLLFLFKQRGDDGAVWRILGAGDEGEMPIEKGSIYCHGTFLEGFERKQKLAVQGGSLDGYKFELAPFLSAVVGFDRCFSLKGKSLQKPCILIQRCSDEAIEAYRQKSDLNRYLIEVSAGQVESKEK